MHILQPKHFKLKPEEAKKLIDDLNISLAQMPKITSEDPSIIELKAGLGDIIKIERKEEDNLVIYYRVVV